MDSCFNKTLVQANADNKKVDCSLSRVTAAIRRPSVRAFHP